LVSVAHEEGKLDDLRAVLGDDIAIQAYREGKQEFPDGTVIARLAWAYTPSEENNKVFRQQQSFVAGAPKEGLQFMVKDGRPLQVAQPEKLCHDPSSQTSFESDNP
jgi:hypothetical protein